MVALIKKMYEWLLRTFWSAEMDVTVVGLQNAGKTSLLQVLAGGEFALDSIPTVGFNLKRVQKGHVTLKCWDIGGQPRFRSMWERYSRGASAILFIVDSADRDQIPQARDELHLLLGHESLAHIPLLVLGNKTDLPGIIETDDLIAALELTRFKEREVGVYGISVKEEHNLQAVVEWLLRNSAAKS